VTWAVTAASGWISMAGGRNVGVTGSASVRVVGGGMGLGAMSVAGVAGGTGCEGTSWESDSSTRCRTGQGWGGSRRVSITVGSQVGSSSGVCSVDMARVGWGRPVNAAASGLASVTVHGLGTGLADGSPSVVAGATVCEATTWRSDTLLVCRAGRRLGGSRHLALTTGGLMGSVSCCLSVDGVGLSLAAESNRAAAGSMVLRVSVLGASMAHVIHTTSGRFGHSACEATTWASQSSTLCSASHGSRRNGRVSLTAGTLSGSIVAVLPEDIGVVSGALQSNMPATGSVSVTLHGAGLGLGSVAGSASSRTGLDTCQSTTWASDSSTVCLARQSGTVGSRRVLLTTALSVSSVTCLLSVSGPLVSSVLRTNMPGTGSAWLAVQGALAGLAGGTA
jgi:hypothetical protein